MSLKKGTTLLVTDGKPGEQGESAYRVAVTNGFKGTETEWLASLKGDTGEKGDTGLQGPQGNDGYSPTVTTEQVEGGNSITITDKITDHKFTVKDGKTPVAGVDYYTEEEKQKFIQDVLDALPDGDKLTYGDEVSY